MDEGTIQGDNPQGSVGWAGELAAGVHLPPFGLLTSHGAVFFYIAANPEARLTDIAEQTGITPRRVSEIIRQLSSEKFLRVMKVGRRNRYAVPDKVDLRHVSMDRALANIAVSALYQPADSYSASSN